MSVEDYFARNPVLLYAGEKIVEEIVDKTNKQCLKVIETPDEDNIVRKKIISFTEEQIKNIKELIPWVTMNTVSNMLQLFEQNRDIKFVVDYNGEEMDIAEVSDGLDGDFLGEDGWIDRFGEYLDFVTADSRRKMSQWIAEEKRRRK